MEEQFVTHEIALKLKELGFDEECFAIYFKGILNNGYSVNYISTDWKSLFYKNKINSESNSIDIVSAPLWQQVQSFLDDNGVIIGIIFVDNVFKYTLNTNNYVSNGFKDRMSAIKSATEYATNYLWDKKFNK